MRARWLLLLALVLHTTGFSRLMQRFGASFLYQATTTPRTPLHSSLTEDATAVTVSGDHATNTKASDNRPEGVGPKGGKRPRFARTNRFEGQRKWIESLTKSLETFESVEATTKRLTEISKELLYSGIPDQVLELYSVYSDLNEQIRQKASNENEDMKSLPSVILDPKLILVVSRAYVSLGNVTGALRLLHACSRVGLEFDSSSKSILMADLACSSPSGLRAALKLRESMIARKERISANGYAGLIDGILQHGMSPRPIKERLLIDDITEEKVLYDETGDNYHLSAPQARELATDLILEHFNVNQSAATFAKYAAKDSIWRLPAKARTHKVMTSYIRLIYRCGKEATKFVYDRNYDLDVAKYRARQASEALDGVLRVLRKFSVDWDIHISDIVLHECLLIGPDITINSIVDKMMDNDVFGRTSTLNNVLECYARSGDGENAYNLVMNVMVPNHSVRPNDETWTLLMDACLRNKRGRYFASKVVAYLEESSSMSKSLWDRYLVLKILNKEPFGEVLLRMVQSDNQPDESTVLLLFQACSDTKQIAEAMKLYKLQCASERRRREYRHEIKQSERFRTAVTQILKGSETYEINDDPTLDDDDSSDDKENGDRSRDGGLTDDSMDEERHGDKISLQSQSIDSECDNGNDVTDDGDACVAELNVSIGDLMGMALPAPSKRTTSALLEIIRNEGDWRAAWGILTDAIGRASTTAEDFTIISEKDEPQKTFKLNQKGEVSKVQGAANEPSDDTQNTKRTIYPLSLSPSGTKILSDELAPDVNIYNYVLETCVKARRADVAVKVFLMLEKAGLQPDRRTYAAMIRVFGNRGDIPNALGVFNEMKTRYVPDVSNLQSVLDVCKRNPLNLRILISVLEDLLSDGYDLDVYSKDILMQAFPDATSLGGALMAMENMKVPDTLALAPASLNVLSVLVQSVRTEPGTPGIIDALQFLGSVGIRCEKETREYFTMPGTSTEAENSEAFSRARKVFQPNKAKRGSVLDVDMPFNMNPDLSMPRSIFDDSDNSTDADAQADDYVESDFDVWHDASRLIQSTILENKDDRIPFTDDDDDDDDDDDNDDTVDRDCEETEEEGEEGAQSDDDIVIILDSSDRTEIDSRRLGRASQKYTPIERTSKSRKFKSSKPPIGAAGKGNQKGTNGEKKYTPQGRKDGQNDGRKGSRKNEQFNKKGHNGRRSFVVPAPKASLEEIAKKYGAVEEAGSAAGSAVKARKAKGENARILKELHEAFSAQRLPENKTATRQQED